MERDEVYVPKTREDLGIPKRAREEIDWEEIFGDTPLYTLYMLVRQQLLAFPAYLRKPHRTSVCGRLSHATLVFNVSGQKSYPWPTSHLDRKLLIYNTL